MDESLYGDRLPALRPDVVLGCGDLPFDYLEYLVSRLDVPVLYVPGNHDPSLRPPDTTWTPMRAVVDLPPPGPEGCTNIDGRVVEVRGLRFAGLGGSLRYKEGPNQYSQGQMGRRALKLELRLRLGRVKNGRKLDVLVTHAPPFGVAEAQDSAHIGFVAFLRLIRNLRPLLAVHGHVHPFGRVLPERRLGATRVVNAIPTRVLDV
ncbi:MAG TPA: metallophosphoesterase [Candidatus Dormibacteraeota bacterium]|nr:metallophosphoesterase [Candidatus Dormibacteraeota bacterium]